MAVRVLGMFDFELAEGMGRGEGVVGGMRDEFTMGVGRLELVFWGRGEGERGGVGEGGR